jgi:hypothetical protein
MSLVSMACRVLFGAAMKILSFVCVMLSSTAAFAQVGIERHMSGFGGNDEISTQVGFQASLGGGTPDGFKIFIDYSHRLSDIVWLNFKINPTISAGASRSICFDGNGNAYDCSSGFQGDGYAIDLLAGVKLKWMTRIHLMPYVNIDGGVVPIFGRPEHDDGAALIVHAGGGVKYFLTPRVALGGEVDFGLGPAFYSQGNYPQSHNEFYRAFNLAFGAEFLL